MKVSELTGELLDRWVANAEVKAGHFTFDREEHDKPLITLNEDGSCSTVFNIAEPHHYGPFRGPGCGNFAPSTDWSYGGPIVERELLRLSEPDPGARHVDSTLDGQWQSMKADWKKREYEHHQFGTTPLLAAMRTYVDSVFGAEVPDTLD